jgi:hypothetical protein
MLWFYIAFFFLTAIAADWLAIRWHEARENLEIVRTMRLSAIIEAINWAPIVFAIDSDILSAKILAGLNIVGTVIGSGIAMVRLKRRKETESEESSRTSG